MSGVCEVDDGGGVNGAYLVERIVSELIDQFRSVGRPLRFYEVEEKLLDRVEKLRLPAEKLEKEKALLREKLKSLGFEKGALEVELRKMRDCVELSGVFSRLGWSGGVDAAEESAEELYEAMLSKLMSGNGEDLSEVVDHLRKKVEGLERDSRDVGVLRRKMEKLEGENVELKRKGDSGSREVWELRKKVKDLEVENVALKRKGERGLRDVGEMRRKIEELEEENAKWRGKVEGGSCDAVKLLRVKEELASANAKLKMKAEGNSWDFVQLRRKAEELEAENKDLKMEREQNVAMLRRRTEDNELQYESLKRGLDESERIHKDLEREKGILERKNEVMQSNFDELARENEKLEKKLSWWKKNYEELDKRVIILEKDVVELKSCDEGVVGPKDIRERHCADGKFASRSKNGNTCYAENGVGNGKHSEAIGRVFSVENRRNDGVHSAALPTGESTPISGGVLELIDSDDDTALAGCPAKKKHSENASDKELPPSSTRELKRESDTIIDLTENENNNQNGADFSGSSSWMTNTKRSKQRHGDKLDGSPRSTRSSSTFLH